MSVGNKKRQLIEIRYFRLLDASILLLATGLAGDILPHQTYYGVCFQESLPGLPGFSHSAELTAKALRVFDTCLD